MPRTAPSHRPRPLNVSFRRRLSPRNLLFVPLSNRQGTVSTVPQRHTTPKIVIPSFAIADSDLVGRDLLFASPCPPRLTSPPRKVAAFPNPTTSASRTSQTTQSWRPCRTHSISA